MTRRREPLQSVVLLDPMSTLPTRSLGLVTVGASRWLTDRLIDRSARS